MYSLLSSGLNSLLVTGMLFLTGCVRYNIDSPAGRDRILDDYSIEWTDKNQRSLDYYRLLKGNKVNEAKELSRNIIVSDLNDARASLKRLQGNEQKVSPEFYSIITQRLNNQISEMEKVLK